MSRSPIYLMVVPKLTALLETDPNFFGLLQTPLTLGLLSYIANAGKIHADNRPEVGQLSARLRVVNDFTMSRWQHESNRSDNLASIEDLVHVLGRVATRSWRVFNKAELQDAAKADAVNATTVLKTALQL